MAGLGIGADRPARNLTVKNQRRNVGIIRRQLPPSLRAGFGCNPYKADKFIRKGLEALYLRQQLMFEAAL